MIVLLQAARTSAIGQALEHVNSPYPPSFDNNPAIFGWALFARLLILLLSTATLIRLRSRNASERVPANHPVYSHRMVIMCLLWAAALGSSSDVLTYLFWGEVTVRATTVVLLLSRLLDAFSIIPFAMALCVRVWIAWLCDIGVFRRSDNFVINGMFHDMRATWASFSVPMMLVMWSAFGSAAVTGMKYWAWLQHGSF